MFRQGVLYTTFHYPELAANVVTTEYSDWATSCPGVQGDSGGCPPDEHPDSFAASGRQRGPVSALIEGPGGAFERRPVRVAATGADREWAIAAEVPVEIQVNGRPWTVMLATPCDVEDLAVGLAITERLVTDAGAVERIGIATWLGEMSVDLTVPVAQLRDSPHDTRSLAGNSGCGLCGLESLASLHAAAAGDRRPPINAAHQ